MQGMKFASESSKVLPLSFLFFTFSRGELDGMEGDRDLFRESLITSYSIDAELKLLVVAARF
jgi:hypothetical protein